MSIKLMTVILASSWYVFTQYVLLIQENFAKIACYGENCTDIQIYQNCAAQLPIFMVGLIFGSFYFNFVYCELSLMLLCSGSFNYITLS